MNRAEAGEAEAPEHPMGSGSARPEEQRRRFGPPTSERQKRFRQRAIPLIAVATIAFVVGAIVGSGSPDQRMGERFVKAWAEQDFAAMYEELSDESRAGISAADFAAAYRSAQAASTAAAIDPGGASRPDGGIVRARVAVRTNLFGVVEGELELPLDDGTIAWERHLTFPGLRRGELVGRRLELGARAPILAADGTPLATGEADSRSSPLGSAAIDVAGSTGEPDSELAPRVAQRGYPTDQPTGISGLELAFNPRLAGQPGGQLLAVPAGTELPDVPPGVDGRVLASSQARPGQQLRTTIDPDLQEVTVAALAGRSGGIAVLNARSGAVKALAGSAFSAPQPPGSTFKVVTTVAALEQNEVKLDEVFPVLTEINAGGRVITNAQDAACGGTFVQSFANSCNTVFAPLGVEIGEQKLVEVAERFGWNEEPSLYDSEATAAVDPPEPSIPEELGDDVDVAATAIGQGRVLATPLNMASVAQAIARGGLRQPTPIVANRELRADQEPVRVTSQQNARIVRSLMEEVVRSGTGTAAALADVTVAGKTGTAELGPKPDQPPPEPVEEGEDPPEPEQIEDAWFIAFAPAQRPRYAVAVMLVDVEGGGGGVAAPIAQQILAAAL